MTYATPLARRLASPALLAIADGVDQITAAGLPLYLWIEGVSHGDRASVRVAIGTAARHLGGPADGRLLWIHGDVDEWHGIADKVQSLLDDVLAVRDRLGPAGPVRWASRLYRTGDPWTPATRHPRSVAVLPAACPRI